jgi:hypothetical protein
VAEPQQTTNKRMAVPLRSTQILLRFTAQNFAMRQPLFAIAGAFFLKTARPWAKKKLKHRK